jgi:hypothetical protein
VIRLLLVATLAACSSPAARWRAPENAESIRVQGELVIRAEPDGTTSVTARVALDADSATGAVRLRGTELASAGQSKHVRLARARAWQALAATLAADPARAFEAANKGTEELSSSVLNDSSMSVKRAELLRMDNKIGEAAVEMAGALRSYLRGYVTKFRDEAW